jgi:hypothetical protein
MIYFPSTTTDDEELNEDEHKPTHYGRMIDHSTYSNVKRGMARFWKLLLPYPSIGALHQLGRYLRRMPTNDT